MSSKVDKIKGIFDTVYDKVLVQHRRKTEIKKFKDKRRVAIYSNVTLSGEQKNAIDKFYVENYEKKIPYVWHRYYTAYTGNFDVEYFPELLAIPEFERFMNPYGSYVQVFGDKNVLPMIAQAVNVKMPETVVSVANGVFRDKNFNIITKKVATEIISDEGRVFIKPTVDSSSGEGCAVLDVVNGEDQKTGKTLSEIFESMGQNFIVQKIIKCHKSISGLYTHSVNTFRIITYRWNGKIEHCPVIMRIGQGGNCLDNAHAGGMFIAVNEDGSLHKTAFLKIENK